MRKIAFNTLLFLLLCFAAYVFPIAAVSGAQLETLGLVGCWSFEEEGPSAQDTSGNLNHGELIGGPVRREALAEEIGRDHDLSFKGSFLEFDGHDDYVRINNAEELSLTEALTIECWIKPSNWNDERHQTFVSKGTHSSGSVNYILGKTAAGYGGKYNNALKFTYNNGNWLDWICKTRVKLKNGAWYHVAVTVDKEVNKVKFWVNGESKSTVTRPFVMGVLSKEDSLVSMPITKNDGPLHIGANGQGEEFYKGAIAEVRIYNRALTANEIKDRFRQGIAK